MLLALAKARLGTNPFTDLDEYRDQFLMRQVIDEGLAPGIGPAALVAIGRNRLRLPASPRRQQAVFQRCRRGVGIDLQQAVPDHRTARDTIAHLRRAIQIADDEIGGIAHHLEDHHAGADVVEQHPVSPLAFSPPGKSGRVAGGAKESARHDDEGERAERCFALIGKAGERDGRRPGCVRDPHAYGQPHTGYCPRRLPPHPTLAPHVSRWHRGRWWLRPAPTDRSPRRERRAVAPAAVAC